MSDQAGASVGRRGRRMSPPRRAHRLHSALLARRADVVTVPENNGVLRGHRVTTPAHPAAFGHLSLLASAVLLALAGATAAADAPLRRFPGERVGRVEGMSAGAMGLLAKPVKQRVSGPALGNAVGAVVSGRACEKVIGPNARGIVAVMADVKPVRRLTSARENEGRAVGERRRAARDPKEAVPTIAGRPLPTAICAIADLRDEPGKKPFVDRQSVQPVRVKRKCICVHATTLIDHRKKLHCESCAS